MEMGNCAGIYLTFFKLKSDRFGMEILKGLQECLKRLGLKSDRFGMEIVSNFNLMSNHSNS